MVVPKYAPGRMPVSEALGRIAQDMEGTGQEAKVRPRAEAGTNPVGTMDDKHVLVKWVGEPAYTTDPRVYIKLALTGQPGGFTERQARVIRAASRIRMATVPGHTREMLAKHGFSRDYAWGARHGTYIQRMTFADAELLKASPDGHEFVIMGQEQEPSLITLPAGYIKIISDKEFRQIEGYIEDNRPIERVTHG